MTQNSLRREVYLLLSEAFKQPTEQGRRERRMIDVCVTRHEYKVAFRPAAGFHIRA